MTAYHRPATLEEALALRAQGQVLPLAGGRIFWRGSKVAKWSREIAYLPQRENVDWNFPITVRRVVAMGR